MPVEIVDRKKMPVNKRNRINFWKELTEYKDMKTALSNGLEDGEALKITLPPEVVKEKRNAARLFKLAAVEFLRESELPYQVVLRGIDGQNPEIYIRPRKVSQ
jgi:hypothetical protein